MNNNHKILFVNAPNPATDYAPSGNYSLFPSLGIISLATHTRKKYPNLDVKVIDGGIFTTDYILKKVDKYKPTILALSVLTPTYKEALKIAEHTKKKHNAVVILGNDHASFFPETILQNRPFVDFVIKSEIGEILLLELIGNIIKQKEKLPSTKGEDGIFYRQGSKIKRTHNPAPVFSEVYKTKEDIPDLNFVKSHYNTYIKNYNKSYKKFHKTKKIPATINTARGCKNWLNRCLYCGIYDIEPKWISPEFFWWIIEEYYKKYKINFFFEVADEFLTFQKFIKDIIKIKSFDLKKKDIELEIYARADEIVEIPDAIKWLKELNITRVNLGLDSGDNKMLKLLRKNLKAGGLTPLEINYQAVKILAKNNISIHASFPIGCIGETLDSIKNTLSFIERISEEFGKSIATLEVSELVPLPNSPSWDILLSKKNSKYYNNLSSEFKKAGIKIDSKNLKFLRKRYKNQDLLSVKGLAKDWIKHFTHISWKDLTMIKKEVKKIANNIGAKYGEAI